MLIRVVRITSVRKQVIWYVISSHVTELADITPLHKKGTKNDRKNYRPVSLTSVVCKASEMIVRQQLMFSFGLQTRSLFLSDLAS